MNTVVEQLIFEGSLFTTGVNNIFVHMAFEVLFAKINFNRFLKRKTIFCKLCTFTSFKKR